MVSLKLSTQVPDFASQESLPSFLGGASKRLNVVSRVETNYTGDKDMELDLGQTVPDFVVPATSYKNIHLKALRGYRVLLFFYPKNHTPACTIETQDFGANYRRFLKQNILIFGVSRDTLDSHERFKREQSLPFELISDSNEGLCHLFGVLREKELFGKRIVSLVRSSFLIDETGRLERSWRDVDARTHVHKLLQELDSSSRRTG